MALSLFSLACKQLAPVFGHPETTLHADTLFLASPSDMCATFDCCLVSFCQFDLHSASSDRFECESMIRHCPEHSGKASALPITDKPIIKQRWDCSYKAPSSQGTIGKAETLLFFLSLENLTRGLQLRIFRKAADKASSPLSLCS